MSSPLDEHADVTTLDVLDRAMSPDDINYKTEGQTR